MEPAPTTKTESLERSDKTVLRNIQVQRDVETRELKPGGVAAGVWESPSAN